MDTKALSYIVSSTKPKSYRLERKRACRCQTCDRTALYVAFYQEKKERSFFDPLNKPWRRSRHASQEFYIYSSLYRISCDFAPGLSNAEKSGSTPVAGPWALAFFNAGGGNQHDEAASCPWRCFFLWRRRAAVRTDRWSILCRYIRTCTVSISSGRGKSAGPGKEREARGAARPIRSARSPTARSPSRGPPWKGPAGKRRRILPSDQVRPCVGALPP